MKILFISDYYPPYIKGGAEVSTSLLADWLAQGNSVLVACAQLAKRSWVENGIPVYPIIRKVDLGEKSFKRIVLYGIGIVTAPLVSAIAVIKLVNQHKPDVINVVPSSYQFIPIIIALQFFSRAPVVIDSRDGSLICPTFYGSDASEDIKHATHGYRCLKKYAIDSALLRFFAKPFAFYEALVFNAYKYFLRFLINNFSGIELVAVSQFMRQQLILNGFGADKVSVIYNIAPEYHHREEGVDNAMPTFAYAGRIEKEKGIFDLVDAVEVLNKENLQFNLQVAGTGFDFNKLQDYLTGKNIKNINLLGFLSPGEVLALYSKSSAIIGPSRSPEPFGRFILESIAVGKPIIATRNGGIPEGIDDGITGVLVDIGSKEQLAAAMRSLIERPEQIDAMRSAIVKKRTEYGVSFIGDKRLKLYKALIAQNSML